MEARLFREVNYFVKKKMMMRKKTADQFNLEVGDVVTLEVVSDEDAGQLGS